MAVRFWTGALATSIDESSRYIQLLLFELKTCVLSDEALTRGRMFPMYGLKTIGYFSLAQSLYAFGDAILMRVGKEALQPSFE